MIRIVLENLSGQVFGLDDSFITDVSYTKEEIDSKISAVLRFKGTVETKSQLPLTGLTRGDVYAVTQDNLEYVWLKDTTTASSVNEWNVLGPIIDLGAYYTKAQINSMLGTIPSGKNIMGMLGLDGTEAKTVKQSLADLAASILSIETSVTNLGTRTTALETSVTGLGTRTTSLETTTTNLGTRTTSLETTAGSHETRIAALEEGGGGGGGGSGFSALFDVTTQKFDDGRGSSTVQAECWLKIIQCALTYSDIRIGSNKIVYRFSNFDLQTLTEANVNREITVALPSAYEEQTTGNKYLLTLKFKFKLEESASTPISNVSFTGGTITTVVSPTAAIAALSNTVTQQGNRLTTVEGSTTSLGNRTTNLETRATTAETDISGLKTRVSTVEDTLSGTVAMKLDEHDTDITNLKNRATTTEDTLATLETTVDSLSDTVTDQGTRLSTAESSITSQGNRLTTAEGTITSHTEQLSTQGTNITNLQTRATALETSTSTLATRATNLETRATTLETDVSLLDSRMSSAESTINSHDARISNAETEVTALDTRMTSAESSITNHGSRISTVEGKVATGLITTYNYDFATSKLSDPLGEKGEGECQMDLLNAVRANKAVRIVAFNKTAVLGDQPVSFALVNSKREAQRIIGVPILNITYYAYFYAHVLSERLAKLEFKYTWKESTEETTPEPMDVVLDSVTVTKFEFSYTAVTSEDAKPETANKGDICVVKKTLGDDTIQYTGYVWDGSQWAAMDGNYDAESVILGSNIQLAGDYTAVGNIKLSSGTLSCKGWSVGKLFKEIFNKTINPTLGAAPTVTLTLNGSGYKEVGEVLVPHYSMTFNQGKYDHSWETAKESDGTAANKWYAEDGRGTTVNKQSADMNSYTMSDDVTYTLNGKADYNAGNYAKDNMGNPSTVRREAGTTAVASKSFTPFRYMYIGSLATDAEITESVIKGFTKFTCGATTKTLKASGGDIPLVTGAKKVVVAIPVRTTGKTVNSACGGYTLNQVLLVSASNTPITSDYKAKDDVMVSGNRSGYAKKAYKVWVYQPAAIDPGEVHSIKIA